MTTNWLDELEQRQFIGPEEGQHVFFPLGPFQGYILPKQAYRVIIRSAHQRLFLYSLGITAITTAFGVIFAIDYFATSLVGVLLALLNYEAVMRRVTRRMHKLPFGFSFRYYARWVDEVGLRRQFFAGVLFVSPLPWGGWNAPAGYIALQLVGAYVLCLSGSLLLTRYKQLRAEARIAE